MMKKLLTAFCVACLSGMAYASDAALSSPNDEFAKLDADSNGSLSKEETSGNAILAKNFDTLDADKNGALSEKEYSNFTALTDVSQ